MQVKKIEVPLDIVLRIFKYVDVREGKRLRLVCREWEYWLSVRTFKVSTCYSVTPLK